MTVGRKDYGAWMKAGMDMWVLGAEAGTVMALRMARIAIGGAAGAAEVELMGREDPSRDRAADAAHDRCARCHPPRHDRTQIEALSAQGRGEQSPVKRQAKRKGGMIRMPCVMVGLAPFLLPVLAGCAPTTPSGLQAGHGSVTTSIWALRSLQDRTVPRSRPEAATLRLSLDHGIMGTASCNDVGGKELTWAVSTDTEGTFLRDPSQPTSTTVVACNGVAATETAGRFWMSMTGARRWSIDHGNLVIRFGDGTTAVLKAIGPAPVRSDDCRKADPNNFDCPPARSARQAKLIFPWFDGHR